MERLLLLGVNITDSRDEILKRGYEAGFQHLEDEIRKNGLASITDKTICDDGFKLGIWISHCRGNYKKGTLKESYAERLKALGIILNFVETQYETGFQHLEEYIHTYGLEALTQKSVCSDGYKLGSWYGNCKRRCKKGNMDQRYIDRFAALGIDLNKSRQGI